MENEFFESNGALGRRAKRSSMKAKQCMISSRLWSSWRVSITWSFINQGSHGDFPHSLLWDYSAECCPGFLYIYHLNCSFFYTQQAPEELKLSIQSETFFSVESLQRFFPKALMGMFLWWKRTPFGIPHSKGICFDSGRSVGWSRAPWWIGWVGLLDWRII